MWFFMWGRRLVVLSFLVRVLGGIRGRWVLIEVDCWEVAVVLYRVVFSYFSCIKEALIRLSVFVF